MFKEEPLTLLFTSVLLRLLGRLIQRSVNRAKFSHIFIYIYGKWQITSGLWLLIKCAYSFGTCYEVQKKKIQIEFSVVILSGYRQWIAGYWQCHLQPFLVQSFSGLKLFTSSYLCLWFGVRVEFQLFGCQVDNPVYHVRHLHCKDLYKLVVVYILSYVKSP